MINKRRVGRQNQCLYRYSAAFRLEQAAGLSFYSKFHNRDKAEILRYVVRTFLLCDKHLDEEAFAKYVKEHEEPKYKDNPEMLDALQRRMEQLLQERALIHG